MVQGCGFRIDSAKIGVVRAIEQHEDLRVSPDAFGYAEERRLREPFHQLEADDFFIE